MHTVILDRDGVINQDSDSYVKSAEEWVPIAGSIEAMARLSRAGWRVVIATNQSGLARGLFDGAALAAMHDKLCGLVEAAGGKVDGIFYCTHGPDAGCECRKPGTGLLQQIEREFAVSLQGCWFVGDSLRDLQAAQRFGCQPVLVRTGKGLATERGLVEAKAEVEGGQKLAESKAEKARGRQLAKSKIEMIAARQEAHSAHANKSLKLEATKALVFDDLAAAADRLIGLRQATEPAKAHD